MFFLQAMQSSRILLCASIFSLTSSIHVNADTTHTTKTQLTAGKNTKDTVSSSLGLGLEEIVITGTRTEKTVIDNPVRVEVISAETIERQHALELSAAIDTIPGLSVRPIRGKEGQEAWMQGISANRVLVLVDGEEVSASTGSSVDLSQVSTADVARIEVVKGATSVLYGSAAMGGVINVITQEPDMGLHYKLSADLGSYGSQNSSENSRQPANQRLNSQVQYKNDQWFASAGVNARFSGGYSVDPEQWNQQGANGHKINSRIALRYTPTDSTYYQLSHELYDQKQNTRITIPSVPYPSEQNKEDNAKRNHTAAKGFWAFDSSELTLSAYNENYTNESKPIEELLRNAEFSSKKVSAIWNIYDLPLQTLTLGSDFFSESLDQYKQEAGEIVEHELQGNGNAKRDSFEFYIQDEIELNTLALLPGIRWQKDSDFSEQVTPKINLRWDLVEQDDFNIFLRGGVGKGYRVPNLKERYYIFDHSHLFYIVMGNPDLEPESSTSYQMGLVISDRSHYQVDVNLFQNDLDDLIEYTFDYEQAGVSVYQYNNIEKAQTKGLELNGSYSFNDNLRIKAGYVYMLTEDKNTGLRLKDRPENQFKTSLDYNTPFGLDISLIGSWQDEEVDIRANKGITVKSPSWSKFDLKLNQEITHALSLYGGINNFTNTQRNFYADYDNRPVEGRLVYLGFKFQH